FIAETSSVAFCLPFSRITSFDNLEVIFASFTDTLTRELEARDVRMSAAQVFIWLYIWEGTKLRHSVEVGKCWLVVLLSHTPKSAVELKLWSS
ncbi:hypothetical protein WG66_002384, partial [Moniliophthora roreri]